MKLTTILLGMTISGCAQVLSITAPAANEVTRGFQYKLTSSCSSCTSIYSVEYDVDGELAGISRTPAYSFQWDTFYVGNGTHSVQATARDALNNTIATSAAVSFKVENNMPQNTCSTTCSDISVGQAFAASVTIPYNAVYTTNLVGLRGGTPAVVSTNFSASTNSTSLSGVALGDAVLAWAYLGSGNASVAMTDSGGNTYNCQTTQQSPVAAISTAFCWSINVAHGGNLTITSTGGTGYTIFAADISGGVNAINTNTGSVSNAAGGSTLVSPGFNPNPTELIFYGAGWNATDSAAFAAGFTGFQDSGKISAVQYKLFTSASLSGSLQFTITSNGVPGASKDTYIFVDGYQAVSDLADTANPITLDLDTTRFSNSGHQVVIGQYNEANCAGCINGVWTQIGGWEQTLTFSNGAVPMELRASATEIVLTTGGSSGNCTGGSSCTLTGTLVKTDGSSSSAAISSCVSSNTGVFSVSGTCTLTAVANGFGQNTMTDSTGRRRVTNVYILTSNGVPHFESNGTVSSGNYDANSVFHTSLFFDGGAAEGGFAPNYTGTQFLTDYGAAGFNTIEASLTNGVGPAGTGISESSWDAAVSSAISSLISLISGYHMHVHLISDEFFRGTPEMFASQYGQCSTFATPCFQYAMQQWAKTGVVLGHSGVDEVSSAWGGNPLQGVDSSGGLNIGTYWSSIVGNGSSCQFTGVPLTEPSLNGIALNGADRFFITGTGQSTLDFNATTNTNLFTFSNSTINNSGSFPCSFNGTFNSGSTAAIQPYVAWTYNSSYAACSPGGAGSPPCPNYIKYDVFKNIRNQLTAISNFPGMTWPTPAGTTGFVGQWAGSVPITPSGSSSPIKMADYWEAYWSLGGVFYLPGKSNLQNLYTSQVGSLYSQLPYTQLNAPVLEETQAITTGYNFQGYQASIASCSGSTITFSAPHGLNNPVIGVSRLWIPGATQSNCNASAASTLNGSITSGATSFAVASVANMAVPGFFVIDQEIKLCKAISSNTISGCATTAQSQAQAHTNGATVTQYFLGYITGAPTATTLSVASATPSQIDSQSSGTLVFQDGSTVSCCAANAVTTVAFPSFNNFGPSAACPATFNSKKGQTFHASGMDNYFNNTTFYYTFDNGTNCNQFNNIFWEMANFASNSGTATATIVADNNYIRGRNWSSNDLGSTLIFASNMLPLLTRAGGTRGYGWTFSPQLYATSAGFQATVQQNNSVFYNFDLGGVAGGWQAQINSRWDYARTFEGWNAIANANLMSLRLLKFVFQAETPAPDYGQYFVATARTGPYGNLLMIQSLADGPTTLSANLAPYLVSGQQIVRECASAYGIEPVSVIASGTSSDSFTYRPGEFCAYLFPADTSAEYSPPAISAALSDITNAAKIAVQFSYTAGGLQWDSVKAQTLLPTVDCGTGTCALPFDLQIGPVWYRLMYLSASGNLLATSDVQTMSQ